MSENIHYISDLNFDKVTMKSKVPVLIDFYADWCGPCRTLSAVMEKVAVKYHDKVLFCKMNVDENPRTPNRYKISAIPTIILFEDGLAVEKVVGLHDAMFYSELLDKHLVSADNDKSDCSEDGENGSIDVPGDTSESDKESD